MNEQEINDLDFNDFLASSYFHLEICYNFIVDNKLLNKIIIDHVCYKCRSNVEYDSLRELLEQKNVSKFLYQVNISNRRISYCRLRNEILVFDKKIRFIELADKKPTKEDRLGFHHIEIYPLECNLDDILNHLKKRNIDIVFRKREHHTTYDVFLPNGFIVRLTDQPLIKKIISSELDF